MHIVKNTIDFKIYFLVLMNLNHNIFMILKQAFLLSIINEELNWE